MGKTVYMSRMFNVEKHTIKIRKRPFTFDSIKSANTVGVIPVMNDGRIILERQYRYVVKEHLYEIPAGHIEKGESASAAARRELKEEIGYNPGSLKMLFSSYPSPGSKTELATFFVATGLSKTEKKLEPDELIRTKVVTLKKAIEMIGGNQIMDHKTIAALLFYATFVSK